MKMPLESRRAAQRVSNNGSAEFKHDVAKAVKCQAQALSPASTEYSVVLAITTISSRWSGVLVLLPWVRTQGSQNQRCGGAPALAGNGTGNYILSHRAGSSTWKR